MCACGGTCLRCFVGIPLGTAPEYRDGEGKVIFTLIDGRKIEFDNVRVESVGPNAMSKGVIGVEFFDSDRVVHVPFVESWEFVY